MCVYVDVISLKKYASKREWKSQSEKSVISMRISRVSVKHWLLYELQIWIEKNTYHFANRFTEQINPDIFFSLRISSAMLKWIIFMVMAWKLSMLYRHTFQYLSCNECCSQIPLLKTIRIMCVDCDDNKFRQPENDNHLKAHYTMLLEKGHKKLRI